MTASRVASVDAETVSQLLEAEERNFHDWMERLMKNGVEDTNAAAAVLAATNRHAALKMLQRGYLQG